MLKDRHAQGPDHLYTIYMDIYDRGDGPALHDQGLLYGAVIYNHGALGTERLRSQGHVHSTKPGTGLRYSEVYEFWTGHGFVYLQKECAPRVSRAFLVQIGPGDKLVIPFGWVHLVIAARDEVLSFGAWCARANHLEYDCLGALGGPAYYFRHDGSLEPNPNYTHIPPIINATASDFPNLGIPTDRPLYTSWREQPELYRFMAFPELLGNIWERL
jgi:glucose-6-phosphate isomerase